MENSIKICSCCNLSKTLDCFRKEKSRYRAKCKSCTKEAYDNYRLENKDKTAIWNRKYRDANKEKEKEYLSKPEVKESRKLSAKKSYQTNKHKYIEKNKAYVASRRDIINARARENWENQYEKYKDRYKLQAKVRSKRVRDQLISKAFKEEITNIYKECDKLKQDTGHEYEVDHIIPLIHSTLCGLHVPWNLQILTKLENGRKSNKIKD